MLKVKHLFIILFLLPVAALYYSCRDKLPPDIRMKGDSLVYLPLNGIYIDSGIQVSDKKSAFFVDTITALNPDSLGLYKYTYIAYDEKFNISAFSRMIQVILTQHNLVKNFMVNETVTSGPHIGSYGPYKIELTSDDADTSKMWISNFGGYGSDVKAYMTFDMLGNLIIPEQSFDEGTLKGTGKVRYDANYFEIIYQLALAKGTDSSNFQATIH